MNFPHLLAPTYRATFRKLVNYRLIPSSRKNICSPLHQTSQLSWKLPNVQTSSNRALTSSSARNFSRSQRCSVSPKLQNHDRGPASSEITQTDFGNLDVLGNTPPPSTSIDACVWDGFHLNSGVRLVGGTGALLVAGEAFSWRPWLTHDDSHMKLINEQGQWDVDDEAWGVFELVWPRPDLLILGLGREMHPVSRRTRQRLNDLGLRLEIQDTRNAAAEFNLLATERGLNNIAAALIPIGWKEGIGVRSEIRRDKDS